ncbi:MAG: CoA pyrophosphatase [Planctomycetes bacterium]|nr:CoA pyrophosphatase [Planctomycetota bacterium]
MTAADDAPAAAAARFDRFAAALAHRLRSAPPGVAAQLPMAPRPRRSPAPGVDPERPIPAAVLALFFPGVASPQVREGEPCFLLTRRTERLAAHRGQVCLPGGALDAGESPQQAALREAHEEVGVDPAEVAVVGRLTPVFIPVSGFRIEPFVAVAARRPTWRRAEQEVDALFEWPVRHLLDRTRRGERLRDREGDRYVTPFFAVEGHEVWGATAMVLAELEALLRELDDASPT